MKYIKALIKTVKQMGDFDRKMFIGLSLLVLGLILLIPTFFIPCLSILILCSLLIGMYFVLSGFWMENKEDLKRFINKIKSNIE